MRLVTDIFAFCQRRGAAAGTPSRISGYHIREAGCDAVQEVAFTLADGIAYVEAALDAGLDVDEFAPRLLVLLQRAQRLPRGGGQVPRGAAAVGAHHARALRRQGPDARWHAALPRADRRARRCTAQQPLVNVVRTTVQALAAVLGGAQSLHTNGYDEALALPTEEAARAGAAHAAGAGPRVRAWPTSSIRWAAPTRVEALTSEIEARAAALHRAIDELGGMVAAIEAGYPQREIERRAYEYQRAIEEKRARSSSASTSSSRASESAARAALHRLDPALEASRSSAAAALRAARDAAAAAGALEALAAAARGTENLLPPILAAVKARATRGRDRRRAARGVRRVPRCLAS